MPHMDPGTSTVLDEDQPPEIELDETDEAEVEETASVNVGGDGPQG